MFQKLKIKKGKSLIPPPPLLYKKIRSPALSNLIILLPTAHKLQFCDNTSTLFIVSDHLYLLLLVFWSVPDLDLDQFKKDQIWIRLI